MVAHLQHVGVEIFLAAPIIQHIVFCGSLHISGKEEGGFSINHLQHNGGIIRFGVGLYRAQHSDRCAGEGNGIAGRGDLDLQILLVYIIYKIIEALGAVGAGRGVDCLCGEYRQHTGQTACMILVGMAADHCRQLLNALLLQIADYQRAVFHISAVNEHVFSAVLQERAVRLPHINEMHLQRTFRAGRGNCDSGGDVHAAAG